jgi:hypothetical protein
MAGTIITRDMNSSNTLLFDMAEYRYAIAFRRAFRKKVSVFAMRCTAPFPHTRRRIVAAVRGIKSEGGDSIRRLRAVSAIGRKRLSEFPYRGVP